MKNGCRDYIVLGGMLSPFLMVWVGPPRCRAGWASSTRKAHLLFSGVTRRKQVDTFWRGVAELNAGRIFQSRQHPPRENGGSEEEEGFSGRE